MVEAILYYHTIGYYNYINNQVNKIAQINHISEGNIEQYLKNPLTISSYKFQHRGKDIQKIVEYKEIMQKIRQILNIKNMFQPFPYAIEDIFLNYIEREDLPQYQQKLKKKFDNAARYQITDDFISSQTLMLKLGLVQLYFNYKDQINKYYVQLVFEEMQHKILLASEKSLQFNILKNYIEKKTSKKFHNLTTIFTYPDKKKLFERQSNIYQKPDKIECFNKTPNIKVNFRKKIMFPELSKKMSPENLKYLIIDFIRKKDKINIDIQNIQLEGTFGKQYTKYQIDQQIQKIQAINKTHLNTIEIVLMLKIKIYYQAENLQIMAESNRNVKFLKQKNQSRFRVPIQSQSLLFIKDNDQQEVVDTTLQQIQPKQLILNFTLISKMNLAHYGFHQNYKLSYQEYEQFHIQRNNDIQEMVNSLTLTKPDEKNFFDQLIKLLYSAIKRRFRFNHITEIVKEKVVQKNSQQIWSSGDFSDHFLLYYILYNSEPQLRVQIMKITRSFMAIPIYFRIFQSINHTKDQWRINEDLLWLLFPGYTIVSIGINSQNLKQEKGKSYLNNLLFFTNFQQQSTKHPISLGCPEIHLNILGNITPVHIIDIPSNTDKKILEQIISMADLLVVHSWKNKDETEKIITNYKRKFAVKNHISILRDCGGRDESIRRVKGMNLQQNKNIQISNLEQYHNKNKEPPFIKILRDKIWQFVNKENSKQNGNKQKKINGVFQNKLFQKFNEKLRKLQDKFLQLKPISQYYQRIKDINRQAKGNEADEIEKIKAKVNFSALAAPLRDILLFILQNIHSSNILMIRLKETLKQLKNIQQKKYSLISKHKKKVSLINKDKKQEFQKARILVEADMKKLFPNVTLKANNPAQLVQSLSSLYQQFQDNIKPNFFTNESLWRQIQYLTTIKPDTLIKNYSLVDFLVDLERKEVSRYQPFQILDGDLLQMPKNIIKRVFQANNDKVAVITILGPQSSGKSTLLNFLFGCDFSTSEGRCTRGVYGTYFKFTNSLCPTCDGIFLIDTQGLFATLNKKDSQKRKNFDSKLVLFCLAVSDFVLINTKGNMDSQSTRILKSCKDRFDALSQQNLEWPEIYLILNQNNSSNLTTSQADINSLRSIFSTQNAFSLNQAYNLTSLKNQDVKMLPQQQSHVLKQPRQQFLSLTNELKDSLFSRIESKLTLRKISVVIDLMERVWSTIQAFPDLGKNTSKNIQWLEEKIKSWRLEKIQNLSNIRELMFERLKNKKITQKKCLQDFEDQMKNICNQYKNKFLSEGQKFQLSQQERLKIQLEQKKIEFTLQSIRYELNLQIKDLQKVRQAQKTRMEGSEYERQAIRLVKKIQRDENRSLTLKQKTEHFDRAFQKTLKKIKQVTAPQKQLQHYFQAIKEYYSNSMNLSTAGKNNKDFSKNAGLPKAQWKCDQKPSISQFSLSLISKIKETIGSGSNKYIQFRKVAPSKVLQEFSKTDAKLQYFNMRKYFKKVNTTYYYTIHRWSLIQAFKFQKILQLKQRYSHKQLLQLQIQNIYDQINSIFRLYGFQMANFHDFKESVQYQRTCWLKSIIKSKPEKILMKSFEPEKNSLPSKKEKKIMKNNNKTNKKKSGIQNTQTQKVKNQWSDKFTDKQAGQMDQERINYYGDQQSEIYQGEAQKNTAKQIEKIKNQKFVDLKSLESFVRSQGHIRSLQVAMKNIIKWNIIVEKIQQGQRYKQSQKQINQIILKQLNKDLSKLNLKINCYDICYQFENHYKPRYYDYKRQMNIQFIKIAQSPKLYKQSQFAAMLKYLEYFDENIIGRRISKQESSGKNCYYIASLSLSTFQVLPQYRLNKGLLSYLEHDTTQTLIDLEKDTMKKFIYQQLFQMGSFNLLFQKINKIINKTCQKLNRSTIQDIFISVSRQIIQFNNDLNQVSHKLTLIFAGYIHLYAIYYIWKKLSDLAIKSANQPYQDLMNSREKQLSFFLSETSDNYREIVQGETNRFLNQILEFIEYIIEKYKQKVNENLAKKFKKNYPRNKVQQMIDNQCFNTSSNQGDWISYLQDPRQVLQYKYQSLKSFSSKVLADEYKQYQDASDLVKQLKQILKQILEKMKNQGINQDTINTEVFRIKKKTNQQLSVSDSQYLQKINVLMMQYFLDLLQCEQKTTYEQVDFDIVINEKFRSIKSHREPTPSLQNLVSYIKSNYLSISRFYIFVEKMIYKLEEKVQLQGVKYNKIDQKINELLKVLEYDEEDYYSRIQIKICKQQCPGCQRICGVEQLHVNNHQCLYGHQMRALGGVKLTNGDASVIRCEDVNLMSEVEFNGKKMTWKQFKHYWQNKAEGSWSFEDLKQSKNKELFLKAWDIAGQFICIKHQMKFVKSNFVESQNIQCLPIHYIFALDQSYSMSGKKWEDLMQSYRKAIEQIKNIPNSEHLIKVTTIPFGTIARIHQQNSQPSKVNTQIIFSKSGTIFSNAFRLVFQLMNKYISESIIRFLFMTDGEAEYPSEEVKLIRQLQVNNPKRIQYYGIEYSSQSQVMQMISTELDGKNNISHNVCQLTNAYIEIINRKVD